MIPHVWSISRLIPLTGITLNRDLAKTLTWLPASRKKEYIVFVVRVCEYFCCNKYKDRQCWEVSVLLWLLSLNVFSCVTEYMSLIYQTSCNPARDNQEITEIYWIDDFPLISWCPTGLIDVLDYQIWVFRRPPNLSLRSSGLIISCLLSLAPVCYS